MRVLITGSEGLIGERLHRHCEDSGFEVAGLDLKAADGGGTGDVRNPVQWAARIGPIDGIVHLAAISRVAWAERDPRTCADINERGTREIVDYALASESRPWLVFASSREVYGTPAGAVVSEDDRLAPVNVYGRSKLAGEQIVAQGREAGLRTAAIRLSNVYGGPRDHPDRAVPGLVANAVANQPITLTGSAHYFDFVHVDDVVRGLLTSMHLLGQGERLLPPIHLATGRPTSLGELAQRSIAAAGSRSAIEESGARGFDVAGFCGDPARAARLLGWRAQIALEEGLARLVGDVRRDGPPKEVEMPR